MPVLCATENFVLQTRGPGRRPPALVDCAATMRMLKASQSLVVSHALHRMIDIAKERHLVICNHRWLRS